MSPHEVKVVPLLIGNLDKIFKNIFRFLSHLDRVNQPRKPGCNGSNSSRLSHPVFLAPKEKNRAGDLLKLVLRGLFTPVRCKVLLRRGEVVGTKHLSVHCLPKMVDVP